MDKKEDVESIPKEKLQKKKKSCFWGFSTSTVAEDVVNLDSESGTGSESLAEFLSELEATILLDCWDNWMS